VIPLIKLKLLIITASLQTIKTEIELPR